MNGLNDKQLAEEIVITIHLVCGEVITQPCTIEETDSVQDFINWFRDPGKDKVYTWWSQEHSTLIAHSNISAIFVDGYYEPMGEESKWYHKLLDKWRARKLYG